MSDLIRIADLEVWTRIGVPDEERAQPQRLLVTLTLSVGDMGPAARKDDVRLTIDYADVAAKVKAFASARPRRLLEAFADELADELLGVFPMSHLRLEVKKFILSDARHVAVEIERPGRKA
jgi:FolB domain-containing protein